MILTIKPQTDTHCDKLLDVVIATMRAVKKKHPEVPSMEIALESMPRAEHCQHQFTIVDVSPNLVMIRCQKCQKIYRVEYSREEVMKEMRPAG